MPGMEPVILAIAGTDPTGAAGLRLDLETITAEGARGAFAITTVLAQNERGVSARRSQPPDLVRAQIDAAFDSLDPVAVKIGVLGTVGVLEAVGAALEDYGRPPVVVDPVLTASSGESLLDAAAVLDLVRILRPTLITPNGPEVERLSGVQVRNPEDAEQAALALIEQGAEAVLVTGGHFEEHRGTDVFVTADGTQHFSMPWVEGPPVRGTGCVLSTAIAVSLGHKRSLFDAIHRGKRFLQASIDKARPLGVRHRILDPHRVQLDSASKEAP